MVAMKYIELKTGYADNGPAWIARVSFSKSGSTVYFLGKALCKRNGVYGNHFDTKTGEEYWISGVKKDGSDRHWAGNGKILLSRDAVDEYLRVTGQEKVDAKRFTVTDLPAAAQDERGEV